MTHYNTGHHQLHKRKRVYKKLEQYPHTDKWKRILDKSMFVIGLIGPFMMIPQILKVHIEKNASSIAISSWILFLFVALSWTIYGLSHKEKVIIISNIAWVISYILIIIGAMFEIIITFFL
jgi:uncharacterized protein with PQ loop repeat